MYDIYIYIYGYIVYQKPINDFNSILLRSIFNLKHLIFAKLSVCVCVAGGLRIEPRTLYILGKQSIPKSTPLSPQAAYFGDFFIWSGNEE